ncbi:co-chaperone YbbN [Corynebacterium sp. NML 150383]|uniref:tetratricopeptide repeat protein n=1 Tax=Corynebacterium TaxID=1716 RepID=UPI000BAA7353|nr:MULTISPECIES: tetratricopeptide repeat protein [Corynebacterium]MCG7254519.1 tetratricopeptide repeat protein [Corynebacterium hadale]MCG7256858.1 tetratricopeptide repeat protein [Corynebacterium hadale]MCG7264501.1 tetratricopeptide repeat protein [Corynebacterium hadale]PAT04652.1 co-chaperone YbbN [Corynebacterium sp. NML 150383]PAT12049.1 co-chaperone YbbN [Corynebacterium hadale]
MPDFGPGAVDLNKLVEQKEAQQQLKEGGFEPFITVTEKDIEARAFQRSVQVPVVLMIGTSRSEDSESLKATLQQLAAGQRKFLVAYVDADATPQVAQMFGLRALPTVVALAAGQPVTNFEGNQPADQLKQWVDALVNNVGPQLQGLDDEPETDAPEPEDPRLAQATAALNRSDFEGATALYNAILADEPDNQPVKQAKATVAVLQRLDPQRRTTDPIAEAEQDPQDVDKQLVAADAEVVAGAPEKAFERLLRYVKAEPKAKERLLELFTLFEPGDPRVINARTALASALF